MQFSEQVAHNLSNSEVWPKLKLEAKETAISTTSVSLTLQHGPLDTGIDQRKRRRPIRYTSDIKPPADVPVSYLHTIEVFAKFVPVRIKADICHSPFSTSGQSDICYEPLRFLATKDRNTIRSTPSFKQESCCSTPSLEPSTPQSISPFQANNLHSARSLLSPLGPSSFAPAKSSSQSPSYPNELFVLQHCAELLDSALLYTFFGLSGSRPTHLDTVSFDGPKLAAIAPSFFSPGYLQAMRQRNTFIPSIARSLHSIIHRSKAKKLGRLHDTDTAPAALAAQLWQLAARHLYDERASRDIRSFLGFGDLLPREQVPDSAAEMLDDGLGAFDDGSVGGSLVDGLSQDSDILFPEEFGCGAEGDGFEDLEFKDLWSDEEKEDMLMNV